MKCDKCNNESSFEIHFYDGEKHRVMNLCKDCYSRYMSEIFPQDENGIDFSRFKDFLNSDEGQAITNILKEAFDVKINFDIMSRINKKNEDESKQDLDKCPNCFKTLEEIIEDKKFGCSECYTTFKDRLDDDFLKNIAQDFEENTEDNKEIKILVNKIEKKEEALKNSIEKEDFEGACELRDEINKLKSDLDNLK